MRGQYCGSLCSSSNLISSHAGSQLVQGIAEWLSTSISIRLTTQTLNFEPTFGSH